MQSIKVPLVLVFALALAAGCSEDDKKTPSGWPDGWTAPDSGLKLDIVSTDLGALPDGLPYSAEGPDIEIVAPKEQEVVIGDVLVVQAKITDPDGVAPDKVELTLQGQQYSMNLTAAADIFEAKVDVSTYDKIRLWIIAEDLNGNKNSSKVLDLLRDPGPRIQFGAPTDGASYKGSVQVQVYVSDTYKITSFEATIGSQKLTQLTNKGTQPNQQKWVGTVKFDDPMFSPPLSGKQVLTATAENSNKAKSTESVTFVVDDQGPTIKILSHQPGELIGGVIKLEADVDDPAEVIASSVKCVIGNNLDTRTVPLKPASPGSTTYEAQFDTRTLTQYDIWPVMSFRAADKLGNEAHEDIVVGLDNGQPIVELDPPKDFYVVQKADQLYHCSQPLDPVGYWAADDKEQVPQIQFLRARVEDQGNHALSAPWVPIATVDLPTVRLFVLDDTSQPLVVDTDGDGYCDDINPKVIPLGSTPQKGQAVAVNLAQIPPGGTANFMPVLDPNIVHPSFCDAWGEAEEPPEPLCKTVNATIAIHYTVSKEPSIYTIPPIGSCPKCMGLPFDFLANTIDDGWACVAAVAKDKLGNRGISPPIRLYVQKKWVRTQKTSGPAGEPSCTGTKDASGTVTNTPCKFRDVRAPTLTPNAGCSVSMCSDCSGYKYPTLEFPQTFFHCDGIEP
jgi:hypothetical protein